MVRQVRVLLAAFVLAITMCSPVMAATPYHGNISDSHKEIFTDILNDVSVFDNYVFWRSGEFQYSMLIGDIIYSENAFTVEDGEMYVIDLIETDSSAWGVSTYNSYKHYLNINYTLTPSDYLVYSDIKGFPKLEERGVTFEFITAFLVLCTIIGTLVCRIFGFVLRERSFT